MAKDPKKWTLVDYNSGLITSFDDKLMWSAYNGIYNIAKVSKVKTDLKIIFAGQPHFIIHPSASVKDLVVETCSAHFIRAFDNEFDKTELIAGMNHILVNTGIDVIDVNIYVDD